MARLNVRVGAMESVKSTEALAIHHNYQSKGLKSVLIKPEIDTKGDTKVVSRMGPSAETDFVFNEKENVREKLLGYAARMAYENIHVVIVDEANFITPEHAIQLHALTVSENKGYGEIPVIAFGLASTALSKPFPGMANLLIFANDYEWKRTICRCASEAWHNTRKENDIFIFQGEDVAIDGEENNGATITYESLCSDCYSQEVKAALADGRPVQRSVLDLMGIDTD